MITLSGHGGWEEGGTSLHKPLQEKVTTPVSLSEKLPDCGNWTWDPTLPVLRNDVLVKVPKRPIPSPWFQLLPPGTQIKTTIFCCFFLRTGNVGSQVKFPQSGNFSERDIGVVTFVTSRCPSFISSSVEWGSTCIVYTRPPDSRKNYYRTHF